MPKEGTFTKRRLSVIEPMMPAVLVLKPIGMLAWIAVTSWSRDQAFCGLCVACAPVLSSVEGLIANGTDSAPIILGQGIVAPGGVFLHGAPITFRNLANERPGNGVPGRRSGLPSPPMSLSRGIYTCSSSCPGMPTFLERGS